MWKKKGVNQFRTLPFFFTALACFAVKKSHFYLKLEKRTFLQKRACKTKGNKVK